MNSPAFSPSGRRIAAVALQEMRSLARQKAPFVLRGLYAGAIVGIVTLISADSFGREPTGDQLAYFGETAFGVVASLQLTLALVLGAFLGIASIHSERLNKTLGLLVLSRLHGWEVILGKLAALFALLFSVLLAGLPVFALIGWAGGVDYVWLGYLTLQTLLFAATAIVTGLAVTVLIRSVGLATMLVIALLFLPVPLGIAYLEGYLQFWTARLLAAPLAAAGEIVGQGQEAGEYWQAKSLLLAVHWIVLSIALAAWALPRAVAASPGRGLRGVFEQLDGLYERINVGGIRFGVGDHRKLRGNPVTWLAYLSSGSDLPRYKFRLISGTLAVMLLAMTLWLFGDLWQALIVFCGYVVFLIAPVMAAANAFGAERSRRTLSTLLATPMTARDLIYGKIGAARRLYLYLILPTLFLLFFGTAFTFGDFGDVLQGFGFLLAESFSAYCVTLLFATSQKNALRGGIAGVAMFGGLHLIAVLGIFLAALLVDGDYWLFAFGVFVIWFGLHLGAFRQAVQEQKALQFNAVVFSVAGTVWAFILFFVIYEKESLFYWCGLAYFVGMSILSLQLLIRSFDRLTDRAA